MAGKRKQQTLSEMQSAFHKIYYKEIAPLMEDFERRRKIELLKFTVILIAAIVIITFCVKGVSDVNMYSLLLFTAIATCVGACFLLYNISKDFTFKLKNECMPAVMKAFANMSWYSGVPKLSNSDIVESDLFAGYNQRNDDDVFKGRYKDVSFSINETYLWYMSGSGKNKIVYDVFKGVIINFAANKNIRNKTIITTKGDLNIKGRNWSLLIIPLMMIPAFIPSSDGLNPGWMILAAVTIICVICLFINNKINQKEVLNEIKLEDTEFCKRYKAYSSDEVEGRYLITTAFMERFKNLQTAFGAKKAKCSFFGGNIMFAISTNKNLFELGSLFTPLNNTRHMKNFFKELTSILELIDYFKLDEKTGL